MYKTIIAILVVIAGVAAYMFLPKQRAPEKVVLPPAPETEVTLYLRGAQEGIAKIAQVNGFAQVQYGLADSPEGAVQPALIHAGTCDNLGDVKHLLELPVDGVSTTDLDVSLAELQAEFPLALNVRKSLDDIGVSVACVNILF